MKFFLDSTDVAEIGRWVDIGLVDGVTTNPSLIARAGENREDVVGRICSIVAGPVSVEVLALEAENMVAEGRELAKIAANATIKLPLTWEGLKACRILSGDGISVNVTLCFSPIQAVLAARAGARFISPFIGRLDDLGVDGMALIADIREAYDIYGLETELLAASIRSVRHANACALAGADIATIPPNVYARMACHPLTDDGLAIFLKDAAAAADTRKPV